MADIMLSEQINALIAERDHLRIVNEQNDKVINLLKTRYDELSRKHTALVDSHQRTIDAMQAKVDRAEFAVAEISTHLMAAANYIMQAARAKRANDELEAEPMPAHPATLSPELRQLLDQTV